MNLSSIKEMIGHWVGIDEAGKGEYFGPLVGAAVLVDESICSMLQGLGVKDSKRLSDKKNQQLAMEIKQVCGIKIQVVSISPEKYNNLYDQFSKEHKNLNHLLAWVHARALENILDKTTHKDLLVIIDKFANERYLNHKLLEKGKKGNVTILQLPKAESDIAVAAASIIARANYITSLKKLSTLYNVELPKGGSNEPIIDAGRKIVFKQGLSGLMKVAKVHFKTTNRIIEIL